MIRSFDAEINEEINEEIERRNKLLAKFKNSRSHSDNESYKKSRNKVQHMIKDKKTNFVIRKLNKRTLEILKISQVAF